MARTTTTALLRTQKSRLDDERSWEDMLLDYEWTLGAKTADDWAAYMKHYQDRQKLYSDDPREMLAAQKKIDSGFRAYQTNEIQRVAIDILEGNATEEDKLNKLTDLYYTSYGNGYYDLAQQLRYQIDNQIIKIQSAYATAAGGGGGGGGWGGSSGSYSDAQDKLIKAQVEAYIGDFKKENMPLYQLEDGTAVTLQDVSNLIKTQGEDGIVDIARQLGFNDAQPAFEMIADLVGTQISELQKMASQIQDPATREQLLASIKELEEYKLDIASDGKTGNLTYREIVDEMNARINGNGKYGFALSGVDGYTLKEFTANDIATGANQMTPDYDKDGKLIGYRFTPMYGSSKSLNANYGYKNGEEVIYELQDGQYRPVRKSELKTTWDGKIFLQKGQFKQGQIFELLGLTEGNDGTLQANKWLQKTLENSGYKLDKGGLFTKAGVVFDPNTGMPEIMSPDGKQVLTWQRLMSGESVPVVWDAKSQNQYLKDIGYSTSMNTTGLQPGASAAAIQAQKTGRFVQPAGTSGILQQAGTVNRINQLQAAELEILRVKEQQRQAEALKMYQAPKTTVTVTANAPAVQGFAVKPYTAPKLAGVQPYVAPKLGAVTTAPSTQMTSGGVSLQGGSSSALYTTGKLQVTSSPTTTGLKVR